MFYEPSESAEAGRIALVIELLTRCGEARIGVSGSSMLPSIWPGDVLTIRRCQIGEVQCGDVAVFARDGRLFAHRAITRRGDMLVTQGDAVPTPDPPVSGAELLGVAVSISRDGQTIGSPAQPGRAGRLVASVVRRSSRASWMLQRGRALGHRLVLQ